MLYHLVTFSPTVDGIAYYDGHGFSRLKESGARYENAIAINASKDVSESHAGIEVIPLPISWSRRQAEQFMGKTIAERMDLLKKWQKIGTRNPHKAKKGARAKSKKKTPGVSVQRKYLARIKPPNGARTATYFWSISDARAKNYATGLLLNRYPKGSKCVSLKATAQTRRVKKKLKT